MSTGSCDSTCIDTGLKTLTEIITAVIQGAQPGAGGEAMVQALTNASLTIRCKLPKDIQENIDNYISKIKDEVSTTIKSIYELYTIVIFSTLFLLVLFNYLTFFFQPSIWSSWLFFFLSILVVIIGFLIIYFGTKSITNNADVYIENILAILKTIKQATESGICCLGGCSACTTC